MIRGTLLDGLLPPGAYWAFADMADVQHAQASLAGGERSAMGSAVPLRQSEFALGRLCARRALAQLGIVGEVGVGPRREPVWPPGCVGAISHQDGMAVAAVASAASFAGLGVDLARNEPLPPGVLDQVATFAEREWMEHSPSPLHWDTLVFSLKESLYKAISAHVGRVVDFSEATLERAGDGLRVRGAVAGVKGERVTLRHRVHGHLMVTTATLV